MLNSVLQFRRLSVMLSAIGLFLGGCSGDVEESESGAGLAETPEEALQADQAVTDDAESVEAESEATVESEGEFSDIMAGERQMFLDAQRKYDAEMARQKAEEESENQ